MEIYYWIGGGLVYAFMCVWAYVKEKQIEEDKKCGN